MKLIKELKMSPGFSNDELINKIVKKLNISKEGILRFEILKQGIDARKKPNVFIVLNVAVDVASAVGDSLKNFEDVFPDHDGLCYPKVHYEKSPVVVGFGPSGMFCALALAIAGLKPVVLEQGKCVDERELDVKKFWTEGKLNVYSNVQFGEGGAGTFSDGKLNTTLNNEYVKKTINELILNGAPEEIYYKNKAHIGTDNLKVVVKNIRNKIIKLGGKVIFNAKFTDFLHKNGKINSILYENLENGEICELETGQLILAVGHSAIETFKLLKNKNVLMHQKPFAMGVRIEHPQEIINKAQYGENYNKNLPSADYKLVEHLPSGRSVFTFCMCPGGQVVASSSEEGTIVTNGMSEFARNREYANSALLVNVLPSDFDGSDFLSGLEFQRKYEKLAYDIAGGNYLAPCETVGSFLGKTKNESMNKCSYMPGVKMCKIEDCLPKFVSDCLREALPLFDKKIKGFASCENLLIAPETRSSCPIQFNRDENYICTYDGLYVIGEGAGYAGGIISSAVDGLKCAEQIIYACKKYKKSGFLKKIKKH